MCRGRATAAAGGTRRCREQPRGLRFAGCGLLASSPAAAAWWPRGGPWPGPGGAEHSWGPGGLQSPEPAGCSLGSPGAGSPRPSAAVGCGQHAGPRVPWQCHQGQSSLRRWQPLSRTHRCWSPSQDGASCHQEFLNCLLQQSQALILTAVSGFCCNVKARDANT